MLVNIESLLNHPFGKGGLAVLLFLLLVGGKLYLTSLDSLPGQTFYGIKRGLETIQLNLAWRSDQREQLLETFNQRRLAEVERLLEQGYQAEVMFLGFVDSASGGEVVVNGVAAQLMAETEIEGQLELGNCVWVHGRTQPLKTLMALSITVVDEADVPFPPATSLIRSGSPVPLDKQVC